MLLKKTFEYAQLTKFQNFRGKKLSSLINTFSFPGSSRNIKKALSSRTSPGRLLLKLIYWNESIQRINIIITTDEYQEQPPTIEEKFSRRQLWGEIWFQKSWYYTLAEFLLASCWDIVTTCSFCFETSAEKSPWTKIYCMENCLSTSIFTY